MATPVVGITGTIGAGKSTLARHLAGEGGEHLDADEIAHELMLPGKPGYEPVVDEFGTYITDESGYISPKILAAEVFTDEQKLRRLEDIIHPLVLEKLDQIVSRSRESFYVIDAPLLFEAEVDRLCHWTICVVASHSTVLRRVDMSADELRRRRRLQWSEEKKKDAADEVVDNNGPVDHLRKKAREFAEKIQPGGAIFEKADRVN